MEPVGGGWFRAFAALPFANSLGYEFLSPSNPFLSASVPDAALPGLTGVVGR